MTETTTTKSKPRKRSRWTGPKRRSAGTEKIPARYTDADQDAATRAREQRGWHNGAKVKA